MARIVNNDKLTFVFTNYGLSRIAEALSDPTVDITLTKVKVGSGDNEEYYEPSTTQGELKGLIETKEFPIVEKELLEDNLTISFHIVIPETFGNCDIREVGLYETVNGEDKLFALSTQQPFVKPSTTDNYLIAIDYYLFLRAQNLAAVYDQIILDPDHQLVTEQNLEDLMNTILFVEGNLADQISHNSYAIGLNRAAQLQQKITEGKANFGYYATYKNYADILDFTGSNSVFGYWVFNYPRRITATSSVVDISSNQYNFSTNKLINNYPRSYSGIMPTLDFGPQDYFYLDPDINMDLLNENKTEDIGFTMLFAISPNSSEEKRTLLARTNYATKTNVFEIYETARNELEIKLFADKDNYILYKTNEGAVPTGIHSVAISYSKEEHNIITFIGGKQVDLTKTVVGTYNHMNSSPTKLFAFTATPEETIYANSGVLRNSDGAPYTGTDWTISEGNVFYKGTAATRTPEKDSATDVMYSWNYDDSVEVHTIYTKDEVVQATSILYNEDYSVYTGEDFTIAPSGDDFIVLYEGNATTAGDPLPSIELQAYVWSLPTETIWTNSSVAPIVLYNADGSLYLGGSWEIRDNGVVYMNKYDATYTSASDIVVPILGVTSYITNAAGQKECFINSKIGVISVIKKDLAEEDLRAVALGLEATLGSNPCMRNY